MGRHIHQIRVLSAAIVLAASAAAAAPATAQTSPAGTATITRAATPKMVNVVGLPVKAPIPAGWAVTSPKQLAGSGSTRYPLMVRTQARAERKSPAQWVRDNRGVNVLALAHPGYSFSQGIAFTDLGADTLTTDAAKKAMKDFPGMTGTSTVRTRFGVAYRVHFTDVDRRTHIRYRGVAAFVRVNGHLLNVTSVGRTAESAQYPNDLALQGVTLR